MVDDFPVMRLDRLLGVHKGTVSKAWHAGKFGTVFKKGGRLAVKLSEVERAVGRKFTPSQISNALRLPRRAFAPAPLDIQLETTLTILEGFERQQRDGELFTREQTLALIEHNLALRDIQWLQLQRRQMNQQSPEGRAIIPHEIPERECPDNDGEPAWVKYQK